MVHRKLYKAGNSIVVAIPSYMLDRAQLDIGSTVEILQGNKTNIIFIKHHDPQSHNKIGNMPKQPVIDPS